MTRHENDVDVLIGGLEQVNGVPQDPSPATPHHKREKRKRDFRFSRLGTGSCANLSSLVSTIKKEEDS